MEQQELIAGGVAEIASSMGLGTSSDEPEENAGDTPQTIEDSPESPAGEAPDEGAEPEGEEAAAAPPETVSTKPAPKSWAKEMHEKWATLPPEVQDYLEKREGDFHKGLEQYREHSTLGKQLNDVLAPYRHLIRAEGLDDSKAVAALMNAHVRLTQGSHESRLATFRQLGESLGFIQRGAQGEAQPIDPVLAQTRQELQEIRNALTQRQRAEYEHHRGQVTREVEEFASKNPHFDEVAADMAVFINAGDDMQTAYGKAVRANPATYAKEQARLEKEIEDRLRKKANGEAQAARKATAANVTGRDTTRSPTEPKGKFLDDKTMRKDLEEILSRQTH